MCAREILNVNGAVLYVKWICAASAHVLGWLQATGRLTLELHNMCSTRQSS